jgi:hypothetical protein
MVQPSNPSFKRAAIDKPVSAPDNRYLRAEG